MVESANMARKRMVLADGHKRFYFGHERGVALRLPPHCSKALREVLGAGVIASLGLLL
jgi:hypothetical protein